jgi:SmpA / OmlA family
MTRHLLTLLLACALSGCATAWLQPPQPGEPLASVRQRLGPPTGEHPLPDGGRRLEYATGPFGKHTWMADFDAAGRLLRFEDVLTEAQFARIEAGMTREQLRAQLGTPSRIWAVRYHDQTVWSYRYHNLACMLFHVGITPQGIVEDTSYGPDPLCERRFFGPDDT